MHTYNMKMRGKLELCGMEFHSYHGCLKEEKLYGKRYMVDFSAYYDISAAVASDDLSDAQDVAGIYRTIAREMAEPSELIETVAARILAAVRDEFPLLEEIEITLSKCNPSLDGPAAYSRISVKDRGRRAQREIEGHEEELYNGE